MTEPMLNSILEFLVLIVGLSVSARVVMALIQRRRTVSMPDPTALEEIRARLTRIEQVTEATAIEVERIGEGQRFTTKLLSEKSASANR